MINKYFDFSFKTIGYILITGGLYLISYFLLTIISVAFENAPELFRYLFVYGFSFIISMFGLWKLSEFQGRRLEYDNDFNLTHQLIFGTCIGTIIDPILLIFLQLIPKLGSIMLRLHYYGMFPGGLFHIYEAMDLNSAIFIGIIIDIPILIVIRSLGLFYGKKIEIKHREYVQDLSKSKAKVKSNSDSGRSWRDSVGNSTANRAEFLKKQNKD